MIGGEDKAMEYVTLTDLGEPDVSIVRKVCGIV